MNVNKIKEKKAKARNLFFTFSISSFIPKQIIKYDNGRRIVRYLVPNGWPITKGKIETIKKVVNKKKDKIKDEIIFGNNLSFLLKRNKILKMDEK